MHIFIIQSIMSIYMYLPVFYFIFYNKNKIFSFQVITFTRNHYLL